MPGLLGNTKMYINLFSIQTPATTKTIAIYWRDTQNNFGSTPCECNTPYGRTSPQIPRDAIAAEPYGWLVIRNANDAYVGETCM